MKKIITLLALCAFTSSTAHARSISSVAKPLKQPITVKPIEPSTPVESGFSSLRASLDSLHMTVGKAFMQKDIVISELKQEIEELKANDPDGFKAVKPVFELTSISQEVAAAIKQYVKIQETEFKVQKANAAPNEKIGIPGSFIFLKKVILPAVEATVVDTTKLTVTAIKNKESLKSAEKVEYIQQRAHAYFDALSSLLQLSEQDSVVPDDTVAATFLMLKNSSTCLSMAVQGAELVAIDSLKPVIELTSTRVALAKSLILRYQDLLKEYEITMDKLLDGVVSIPTPVPETTSQVTQIKTFLGARQASKYIALLQAHKSSTDSNVVHSFTAELRTNIVVAQSLIEFWTKQETFWSNVSESTANNFAYIYANNLHSSLKYYADKVTDYEITIDSLIKADDSNEEEIYTLLTQNYTDMVRYQGLSAAFASGLDRRQVYQGYRIVTAFDDQAALAARLVVRYKKLITGYEISLDDLIQKDNGSDEIKEVLAEIRENHRIAKELVTFWTDVSKQYDSYITKVGEKLDFKGDKKNIDYSVLSVIKNLLLSVTDGHVSMDSLIKAKRNNDEVQKLKEEVAKNIKIGNMKIELLMDGVDQSKVFPPVASPISTAQPVVKEASSLVRG